MSPAPAGQRGNERFIDEFQRELIVEGTREGLDAARARGRSGGRRPKLSAVKAATVRRMYQATGPDGKRLHTVAEIAQTNRAARRRRRPGRAPGQRPVPPAPQAPARSRR
jgi:hypothetical protein